jgi:leucyl aminopeptidase
VTTLKLTGGAAATTKGDALLIGMHNGYPGSATALTLTPGAAKVDKAAFKGKLLATLKSLGATGKEGEVIKLASLGATSAPLIAVASAGRLTGPEQLRRAIGAGIRALAGSKNVVVELNAVKDEPFFRAAFEGALLGAYQFTAYKKAAADAPTTITFVVDDPKSKVAAAALKRAVAVAEGVSLVRDLVNTSPAHLHPQELADAARAVAAKGKLDVEVLDEKALKRGGYGGILGVGQGSTHPPRLIRLAYTHPKAKKTVVLVGKGITFDSGGISIKPAAGMEWMKSDMGGAAAVIATLQVVAALKPAVNVIGYAPTAENMPSGSAIRPSDVLVTYAGKTVEVLNTDAEGRLILVDGIARGLEDKPDVLIDVATLTGAQLVALGSRTAGVMGNDDALRTGICTAAERAGEQVWPMPLPVELRPSLDSSVADIANIGDRYGGMLTAGLFLKDWVPDDIRWAHIDIAGPAFNQGEAWSYTPKGGTGFAVRTFVQLIEDVAAGEV